MKLKVFTISEAGKILRLHRTYISRLIKERKIRALKLGKSYRILSEDLISFAGGDIEAQFLTINEVAALLRIHRLYVNRLISGKKLKAIRIGKIYRISEIHLAEYIGLKGRSRIFTINEVSRLLQINRITVINLIRQKKLQAFKIGKFYRVDKRMLDKFLKVKEMA